MKPALLFFFFCGLCLSSVVYAQESKQLKGKVIAPNKDVTGVVVRNINTQNAVITDFEGNFSINVQRNDTLIFLAVQFKNKVLPITSSVYNTAFVNVPLEEFVNELDEVEVRPFNLSGKLDEDVKTLQLEKDVSAEALGLPNAGARIPTQSERKLQEASKGMYSLSRPLTVSLNPIINAITGRTKMLKNRVKIDATYAQTQEVQVSFDHRFFKEVLKIPDEKVDDFMYFCEVDSTFQEIVDTGDQLKMWEFLRFKSVDYRKNNGLE
ncbi:carboxypeptidase-like regulatory domain-containing protein [Allomuricauda sp. d1]|uniref:carboxypeptidase-like regulatory domain-containing protein n=1 Tax=Allomuricauda sp. d1 TaxID=3136725 RepID=UPI0031D5B078